MEYTKYDKYNLKTMDYNKPTKIKGVMIIRLQKDVYNVVHHICKQYPDNINLMTLSYINLTWQKMTLHIDDEISY